MLYQDLLKKLDVFIRKYYKNQLIKGVIYSLALGLSLWLIIGLLEYFGQFGKVIRSILFFSFSASLLFILYRFIITPLLKLYRIGKTLSYMQAADIIGKHFSEIKDKLLNTLQLKEAAESQSDNSLLLASIEQKTKELAPFSFQNAVDYSVNRTYLKWAAIPLFFIILVLVFSPGLLTKSTERIVKFNQEFKPEAPFRFVLQDGKLELNENEDLPLLLSIEGNVIPEEVYVVINEQSYRMKIEDHGKFSYLVRNVRKNFSFYFLADGFESAVYEVNVLAKSALTGLKITAHFPAYTQKAMETFSGTGDLMVPEGTKLDWQMMTKNTQSLKILVEGDSAFSLQKGPVFSFSKSMKESVQYSLLLLSSKQNHADSLHYSIQVIKDAFPQIEIDQRADSVVQTLFYFMGKIQDDYGFKSLQFHYGLSTGNEEPEKFLSQSIPFSASALQQNFLYAFNFKSLSPKPGDNIHYYFTVGDNDGVNGSKISRSARSIYRIPGKEELRKQEMESSSSIKNNLTESVKQAREWQKEAEKLNQDLLQKRSLTWEDKKKIDDLLNKQKELEKKIEELKKEFEIKNFKKDQFFEKSEEERAKEEELQKLLDELMSDELRELMEKLEALKESEDPKALQKQMEEMKMDTKDLEKQLERTLELYKQMELEMLLKEAVEDLSKLAQEQKDLARETESLKGKEEEKKADILSKQEELNERFEEMKKRLDEIEEKNEALEKPNSELKNTDEQQEKISEQQKSGQESLEQGKEKKAAEQQQNAGDQMQQLSQQLEAQQQEMEDNNESEDLESMRRLLDNLLKLSFQQEQLIQQLDKTNPNSPAYKNIGREQRKLQDDAKVVEDSLFALSKRQAKLSSQINKYISETGASMNSAVQALGERRSNVASTQQQYALTGINNLALLLSESIENAQQEMMMKKGGSSSGNKACKKPGAGNPSPSEMQKMSEMQKKLGEQMQKMAKQKSDQMKKDGNQPKGEKSGEKPGKPGEGTSGSEGEQSQESREFAQMALRQSQLKKMLQDMLEQTIDPEQRRMMQEIQQRMDETETDLYNKRISAQTLQRQNEIMVKMLESEKALREQEEDESRESQSADDFIPENIQKYVEWKKLQESMKDVIRSVPAEYVPYYRNKVQQFFNKAQ